MLTENENLDNVESSNTFRTTVFALNSQFRAYLIIIIRARNISLAKYVISASMKNAEVCLTLCLTSLESGG